MMRKTAVPLAKVGKRRVSSKSAAVRHDDVNLRAVEEAVSAEVAAFASALPQRFRIQDWSVAREDIEGPVFLVRLFIDDAKPIPAATLKKYQLLTDRIRERTFDLQIEEWPLVILTDVGALKR